MKKPDVRAIVKAQIETDNSISEKKQESDFARQKIAEPQRGFSVSKLADGALAPSQKLFIAI
jgi:hypothetical protein